MFFDQLAIRTICYPLEEQNIKHVGLQAGAQPSLITVALLFPGRALYFLWRPSESSWRLRRRRRRRRRRRGYILLSCGSSGLLLSQLSVSKTFPSFPPSCSPPAFPPILAGGGGERCCAGSSGRPGNHAEQKYQKA